MREGLFRRSGKTVGTLCCFGVGWFWPEHCQRVSDSQYSLTDHIQGLIRLSKLLMDYLCSLGVKEQLLTLLGLDLLSMYIVQTSYHFQLFSAARHAGGCKGHRILWAEENLPPFSICPSASVQLMLTFERSILESQG